MNKRGHSQVIDALSEGQNITGADEGARRNKLKKERQVRLRGYHQVGLAAYREIERADSI